LFCRDRGKHRLRVIHKKKPRRNAAELVVWAIKRLSLLLLTALLATLLVWLLPALLAALTGLLALLAGLLLPALAALLAALGLGCLPYSLAAQEP
jgi:hypothetical protein